MSDKEILQACEMRLYGYTWQEVADKLNYHVSTVQGAVKDRVFHGKSGKVKTCHVNVQRWMCKEGVSGDMLAKAAGVSRNTVYNNLCRVTISKCVATAICEMSGMTMEQVQEVELR